VNFENLFSPPYRISRINDYAQRDPVGFLQESDAWYDAQVMHTAEMILENRSSSPIVLLSGPSGSGKTTTAKKLAQALYTHGVRTHTISMDDYFLSRDEYEVPLAEDGTPDLESPLCMDMELLNDHFTRLSAGETVLVPSFDFTTQSRNAEPSLTLHLAKDEVAVFEGIHALNDEITLAHPEAFKLYISASADVVDDDGAAVMRGSWVRLIRRSIRDHLFRGSAPENTIRMWGNVCAGEEKYITPFIGKADFRFNTHLPYEICCVNDLAAALFETLPENVDRLHELRRIRPNIQLFADIDPALVAPDSLLREFIGGGIYEY